MSEPDFGQERNFRDAPAAVRDRVARLWLATRDVIYAWPARVLEVVQRLEAAKCSAGCSCDTCEMSDVIAVALVATARSRHERNS